MSEELKGSYIGSYIGSYRGVILGVLAPLCYASVTALQMPSERGVKREL